ncbi:MAG TPA: hypothetical protein VN108_11195 [Marmoricola sp.]|nr:hypothetical protein [Marmoricola sp.]
MKRTFLKAGAALGVVSVAVLAAGPAVAATEPDSQATAQSLILTIGGTSVIAQNVSAVNDGTQTTTTNTSTVPNLVNALGTNNLLGIGIALQSATAKKDGTSYACAGVAGQGSSGLVNVGGQGCNIDGKPMTIDLGNLNLGGSLLDPGAAISGAIANTPLGPALNQVVTALQANLVTALSNGLKATGISIGGSLSAIEGTCQANPKVATGAAHLVDSTGGNSNTPIVLTVGGQKLTVLNLPANPKPNTKLVADLSQTTTMLTNALQQEVNTVLGGQLGSIPGLSTLLPTLQDQLLSQLETQLKPLTDALSKYVIEADLNTQVSSDNGRKIDVTAFKLHVLPATAQFLNGASLIDATIGKVTCGPNAGPAKTATPTPTPSKTPSNNVPKNIDSGLGGGSNTGTIIAAMSVLLAAGGAAGATAYRRYWMPRG